MDTKKALKLSSYKGIEYKVTAPVQKHAHAALYIWNDLTKQLIFERSMGKHEVGEDIIEQLIIDGFLPNHTS